MEERRVFKPPLTSRSASGQGGSNPKSSRLPKPSSRPSSSRPTISRPISQPRPQIPHSTSSSSSSSSSCSTPPSSAGSSPIKASFPSSSSLAYLESSPRNSSLTTPLPSLSSRRNLSFSTVSLECSSIPSPPSLDSTSRPHSFPPLQKIRETPHRLPPRVLQDPRNPSLDPFKVHANRVLRPSASSSRPTSSISTASLPLPPRSSSLSSPPLSKHYPQSTSSSSSPSLRRTATVRSAGNPSSSRHSTAPTTTPASGSRIVGSSRRSRRKPSISGQEAFLMVRNSSSNSTSREGGRSGKVLLEEEEEEVGDGFVDTAAGRREENEEDLVHHWKTFVGGGGRSANGFTPSSLSPLIDQLPPTSAFESPNLSSPPPTRKNHRQKRVPSSPISHPIFSPTEFLLSSSSSSPVRSLSSTSTSTSSTYSPRKKEPLSISPIPRELSKTLPRLNRYLHTTRTSRSNPPPPRTTLEQQSESESVVGVVEGESGEMMTRVDSEVLLTRLTLKRLGSRGFEGDALDRLGRSTRGGAGAGGEEWEDEDDLRTTTVLVEEEDEVEDWADRYRDSFGREEEEEVTLEERPEDPPSPSYSSSSSSSSEGSTGSIGRKAWKWNPTHPTASTMNSGVGGGGLPKSESSSTMSSSTSIGTLSRNWSKSTLMEELEKEVGRLSRDFGNDEEVVEAWRAGGQDGGEEEEYVCALDLIFEEDQESEHEEEVEVPVRRGGGPLLAPLGYSTPSSSSRLPRPKPSSGNLRQVPPPPVPSVPSGFVSRLAQPSSVANKWRAGWV